MASALSHPVTLVAAILGVLLAALVPTCLYLYVEPRGRSGWGVAGDSPRSRRAPLLVRVAAWTSFALGQLALPWLLVPVACVGLVVLQAKLGVGRPLGGVVTILLGAMGLAQTFLALRLIPLGVRLLTHHGPSWSRLGATAKRSGLASGTLLALGVLLGWGMGRVPGLVHPWLRATLVWTALRPVMAYAAAGLLHALLLDRCARAHTGSSQQSE